MASPAEDEDGIQTKDENAEQSESGTSVDQIVEASAKTQDSEAPLNDMAQSLLTDGDITHVTPQQTIGPQTAKETNHDEDGIQPIDEKAEQYESGTSADQIFESSATTTQDSEAPLNDVDQPLLTDGDIAHVTPQQKVGPQTAKETNHDGDGIQPMNEKAEQSDSGTSVDQILESSAKTQDSETPQNDMIQPLLTDGDIAPVTPQQTFGPQKVEETSQDITIPLDTTVYAETIERLDLKRFFPGKLSLRDVQAEWSRTGDSAADLAWIILRQILMGDYRARDEPVQRYNDKLKKSTNANEPSRSKFGISRPRLKKSTPEPKLLHPIDVLLSVIVSSDPLLRQALYEKLFTCRLSVPLVIPYDHYSAEFMLWALKRIILTWKENASGSECPTVKEGDGSSLSDKAFELPADSAKIPIVTFLRLGEIPLSKSALINSILGSKNNTFFTKECPGGRVLKSNKEGIIDMAWHLPTKTSVGRPFVYLNLRGKAELNETHIDVLFNISDAITIVTTTDNFSNTKEKILQFAELSKYLIVVLLLGKTKPDNFESLLDDLETVVGVHEDKMSILFSFDFNDENQLYEEKKNMHEIKTEILQELKKIHIDADQQFNGLSQRVKQLQLLKSSSEVIGDHETQLQGQKKIDSSADSQEPFHNTSPENARSFSWGIDELTPTCQAGFRLFTNLNDIVKQLSASEIKQTLELQGPTYSSWVELSRKERKPGFKRSKTLTDEERDQICMRKRQLRKKQADLYQSGGNFMKSFLKHLEESHCDEIQAVYLQYVRLYLDSMSRKYIPDINAKYSIIWEEVRKCSDDEAKRELQTQLKHTGDDLVNASLGLEHIYREMAQIYEAFTTCEIQSSVTDLPKLMASQILKGHPFEIMNGDSACVPIRWLDDIFKELKTILGDKKICVLSVLGVQSSGKSTLLNAMFGLEFAVSAGRCTRGIFAQLIEMNEENCPFDYLLIVDTEGLRAPELRDVYFDHDNELATLILGIGDITIINLKGENTSEIKDVLQIAVHALLKLKVANKCRDLHQQCVFIHQNVSSVTAKSKMKYAQQQLEDTLNEMLRN